MLLEIPVTKEQFAQRLRELCFLKGVNGSELAVSTGLRQSLISDYLRGKSEPSFTKAMAIADALGVTLNELGIEANTDPGFPKKGRRRKLALPDDEDPLE